MKRFGHFRDTYNLVLEFSNRCITKDEKTSDWLEDHWVVEKFNRIRGAPSDFNGFDFHVEIKCLGLLFVLHEFLDYDDLEVSILFIIELVLDRNLYRSVLIQRAL